MMQCCSFQDEISPHWYVLYAIHLIGILLRKTLWPCMADSKQLLRTWRCLDDVAWPLDWLPLLTHLQWAAVPVNDSADAETFKKKTYSEDGCELSRLTAWPCHWSHKPVSNFIGFKDFNICYNIAAKFMHQILRISQCKTCYKFLL